MKDLSNLRASMDDATAASPYGRGYRSTPYPAFRVLSAVINIGIAATILVSA